MKTLRLLLTIVVPALAMTLMTGCETDSASEQVRISPETVTVNTGDAVEFTAASGYEYSWSLDGSDVYGYLQSRTGQRVTYVCTASPISNSITRTLTVHSTIANSGSGSGSTTTTTSGTNGTTTTTSLPAEWSATAQIIHLPVSPSPEPEPNPIVSISPANTTVSTLNESVTFTASGGDGTYSWSMNPSSWGSLTYPSANQAVYTVSSINTNLAPFTTTLTVTSDGNSAQAVVVHSF